MLLRRPPSCLGSGSSSVRRCPAALPHRPLQTTRAAAVVARAAKRRPQQPRQRKSKAERSRPSADDVAAFLNDDDEGDWISDNDDDDGGDDDGDESLEARRAAAYRRTRGGRAVPLPLTAPPPGDFDKAALAAADRGDPAALLAAARGQTYRVFADEAQDAAWQEQQRRIAQRDRRQRMAEAAAAAAAAAQAATASSSADGAPATAADPAALAKAAGLPLPPAPDSRAAALLRVQGEQGIARPARVWNPRTGFARTPEEAEAEERAAAAALADVAAQGPTTLERVSAERRRVWEREEKRRRKQGGGGSGAGGQEAAAATARDAAAATTAALSSSSSSPDSPPPPAPTERPTPPPESVPRSQVLVSAAATGAAMTGLALLLRAFAASGVAAPLTGGDQAAVDALVGAWSPLPPPPTQQALALAVGTAAAVTSARLALCALLPASFGAQTARSNASVLTPLVWPADDALVALVSGVPEELLFRGALVPATGHPDAVGVAAAAALFGVLHLGGGGRGPAFALWATGVGGVYGALMLAAGGNAWAPAAAHVLANFASATAWRMGAVKAAAVDDEVGRGG